MNRCKNCRRTGLLKLVTTTTLEDNIINTYMCECGYMEKHTYKLEKIEGRIMGTLIYTEKDRKRNSNDL